MANALRCLRRRTMNCNIESSQPQAERCPSLSLSFDKPFHLLSCRNDLLRPLVDQNRLGMVIAAFLHCDLSSTEPT